MNQNRFRIIPRRSLGFAALWLVLATVTGCGYQVGAPFNPEIRSVYVPVFKSISSRRFLEYELTEAVQNQIKQRAHMRLVKEEEADTKLSGRIIDMRKTALGQTENSDARELQMNLQVEVTWEDLRTGKILAQQRVPLPAEMVQLAAQAEFAPEVGQSLATADQTVIKRLAQNIVDMMEMPW
ncbi:MAG: hypothetical protein JSS02_09300 [Planctomycetes bacterium]|nr:hypothetical protein [Planctomycetota bacterium]